jgi:hypothetical protein
MMQNELASFNGIFFWNLPGGTEGDIRLPVKCSSFSPLRY